MTSAAQLIAQLKRRFLRAPTRLDAIITPLVMDVPIDCLIEEISEGGARLRLSDAAVPVGSLFDLHIPSLGKRRRCYLVWRHRNRLGVEFVERW